MHAIKSDRSRCVYAKKFGEAAGAAAGASHSKLPPLLSAPAGDARN